MYECRRYDTKRASICLTSRECCPFGECRPYGAQKCAETINPGLAPWAMQECRPVGVLRRPQLNRCDYAYLFQRGRRDVKKKAVIRINLVTAFLESIALCGTRCVIFDIQAPSFTRVNSLRLQSQCLAITAFCKAPQKDKFYLSFWRPSGVLYFVVLCAYPKKLSLYAH